MSAPSPRAAAVRLAIAGAAGRMGHALIEAANGDARFAVGAGIEAPGHPAIGRDAGEFLGVDLGAPITADVEGALRGVSCLIEFTRPAATLEHLAVARRLGVPMVIGTTGFSDGERQQIQEAATRLPIVLAANMAVGVNVVYKLAGEAARSLGTDFDVEIIEAHHRHKVDAPSGTALRLGQIVAQAMGGSELGARARHGREGHTGERDRGTIGFHAIRGGDIVGEHTVLFAGAGERIEITVRSSSRTTYAAGALRAAAFLQGKSGGLFDMADVLGLR